MKHDQLLHGEVGQYALIKNHVGALLVLERHHSKHWSLPGGRVQNDEDWRESVVREIKEETNLEAIEIKPFAVNLLVNEHQRKYCVYFEVTVSDLSDIQLCMEHSNFGWIHKEDVPNMTFDDEKVANVILDFLEN